MSHFHAWLWLAGIDDVDWLLQYQEYGKANLVIVSIALDFDWRAADDGKWRNADGAPGRKPDADEIEKLAERARAIREALDARLDR